MQELTIRLEKFLHVLSHSRSLGLQLGGAVSEPMAASWRFVLLDSELGR